MSITHSVSAESLRDEFITMRKAGFSYRAIGMKFGLSHERVRQVLVADGEPSDWARTPVRVARKAQIAEIDAWLEEHGPVSRDEVIEKFGLTRSKMTQLIAEGLPSHQMLMNALETTPHFSDEQVVEAVRVAWRELQVVNPRSTGISHVMYERIRRTDDPSAAILVSRYGWERVCELAGVPAGHAWRPKDSYTTRWTDEEILARVADYARAALDEGTRPSYLGYERFQQLDENFPSGTLVRNRMRAIGLATWPQVVMTATGT